MTKRFHVVGRGIGLAIGCNTFPTWNSYPGMLASLATGNAVVVKPHPRAVLPLAISVDVAREVLAENGFDPNLMVLAAEADGEGLAKPLAQHPRIGIIDYTGGPGFGRWLEENIHHARRLHREGRPEHGRRRLHRRPAGSDAATSRSPLSLYSGQMCTAPQNIYLPAAGIDTEAGSHLGRGVRRGAGEGRPEAHR